MKGSTFCDENGRTMSLPLLKSALQKGVRQGTPMADSAIQMGVEGLRHARPLLNSADQERAWSNVRANLCNRLLVIMCEEVFSAISSEARLQLLRLYRDASRGLDAAAYLALVRHLRGAARTHCRFPSYMYALVTLVYCPPYADVAAAEVPGLNSELREKLRALRAAARARGTESDIHGFRYDVKDNGIGERFTAHKRHDEKILRQHLRKKIPGTRKYDNSVFTAFQAGEDAAMAAAAALPPAALAALRLPLEAHWLHRLASKVNELRLKKMHMAVMLMPQIVPGVAGRFPLEVMEPCPAHAPPMVSDEVLHQCGVYDLHVAESPPHQKTYTFFSENSAITPRTHPAIWAAAVAVDGVSLTLGQMWELYKASKRLQDLYPPTKMVKPAGVELVRTRTAEDRVREAYERGDVLDVDSPPPSPKRARCNVIDVT